MILSLEWKKTGLSGPVAFGVGLLLLALSPIFRGGNRYAALVGLEWLSLLVLWLLAISWLAGNTSVSSLRRFEWALILSPLWAALLFLVPVPASIWAALPGRASYLQLIDSSWRPISLVPDATIVSLLASIPLVTAFMLARTATDRQLSLLPPVLVLIAFGQAVWGLLQAGPFKGLYFDAEFAGGLIGGFGNANHFANFIAMALPLVIFLLWRALPVHQRRQQRPPPSAILWSLVLLVLITALMASGSRTGMVVGLLVTFLSVLLLLGAVSEKSRRWYLVGGGLLLLTVVLVIVGKNALVTRFDTGRLGHDASFRWLLISTSWQAAQAFWPVGSGPGSYSVVYPLFQPPGLRGFAEHAHNDYVQLLMEFGALFVMLFGLLIWEVVRQGLLLWRQTGRAGQGRTLAQLQLCCGLGVLAVMLHSWVDFNLHIPANAMLSACLLGAFLRPHRASSASSNEIVC